MELTWLDPENPADRDLAGGAALIEAARAVDTPHQITLTVPTFASRVRSGWDGDAPVAALHYDKRGRANGLLEIWMSTWDNRHLGHVDVTVDPVARRQGIGRRLFEAGIERVRADGRTVLTTNGFDDPAANGFAKAMGLDRASETIFRRQHLPTLDWDRLDREYEDAERHAAGYELVRMPGAVPDELVDEVLVMTAAINDAPTDDLDIEDEVFTPVRLRRFEHGQVIRGRRLYRLVARERATGVLAGNTVVSVLSDRPWHANQYDTSVVRAHRGHRLGLLLKLGMLRWLAEEEPQIRVIDTDNAASNSHMINVNVILGYEVTAKAIGWQKHL